MPKYNVTIEIDYKSYHEEEIEAEDESAAEKKVEEESAYTRVKEFNDSDKVIHEP